MNKLYAEVDSFVLSFLCFILYFVTEKLFLPIFFMSGKWFPNKCQIVMIHNVKTNI